MLDFPLRELLDEDLSQSWLLKKMHPNGLSCPGGHPLPPDQAPHRVNAQGIPNFRCRECGKVFNLFTGTIFSKTRQHASTLVLFLRGVAQGQTTAQLSRELDWNYDTVLELRHRAQALLEEGFSPLGTPRHRGRGRRDVPERGREGNPPPRSRRSAPKARQQATGSGDV